MSDEERVAAQLSEAISILQTEPARAASLLGHVAEALRPHDDLRDVLARTCSLLAQAQLALGDVDAAEQAIRDAARLARALGDDDGLREVRELQTRVAAERERVARERAARRQAEPLAARTLEQVEADARSPLALADALIKHAGALRIVGDTQRAARSAARAVQAADDAGTVRERVLARIALAEVAPDDAEPALREALAIADAASETTLIGLVARAAQLTGVELPAQYGPDLPSAAGLSPQPEAG